METESVPGHSQTQARNTKKVRAWCFTWNNYTSDDVKYLQKELEKSKFLFGEEIGTSGTPHLQGVVRFTNAMHFDTVRKLFKENHVEPCKKWIASLNYCSKDGITYSNIPGKGTLTRKEFLMRKYYNEAIWRDWQKEMIEIAESPPDDRKIHWFWETAGNIGKSFAAKYLYMKWDAIVADGKKENVFNQVKLWLDTHPESEHPKLVILDVPRYNKDFINYGALEALKNGFMYSGKYEGGVCVFDHPHVFIFANEPPDESAMSSDRWIIKHIQ